MVNVGHLGEKPPPTHRVFFGCKQDDVTRGIKSRSWIGLLCLCLRSLSYSISMILDGDTNQQIDNSSQHQLQSDDPQCDSGERRSDYLEPVQL